jgi:hypothetical protein
MVTLIASIGVAQSVNSGLVDGISYLIEKEPHPKHGDIEWATEIAMAIEEAAIAYDLDPWLLTAMAEIESDFTPAVLSLKKLGPGGEKGLLQCGKDCARKCPHFMDNVQGQALCGARWLRMAFDVCEGKGGRHSDEWAGLAYYASGKYCDPPPDARPSEKGLTYKQKADKRIKLRDRLKNRFGQ